MPSRKGIKNEREFELQAHQTPQFGLFNEQNHVKESVMQELEKENGNYYDEK